MNKEKTEITVRPDLPLLESLQSKILSLTKSLPEFKHSKKMFGRTNSQYTSQLMSLTMLGDGPYHFMKQCSAQIDNKVAALQGVYFSMKKKVYKIKKEKINPFAILFSELSKSNKPPKVTAIIL